MIKLKENNKFYLIVVLLLTLLGIFIYMFFNTNLRLNSDTVTQLYSYIGNESLTNCNSSLFYTGSTSSYTSADDDALLCNAYLYIEGSGEEVEFEVGEEETCSVDALLLDNDYNQDICTATKYLVEDLEDAYFTIYGYDLEEYSTFTLSNGNICSYNEADGYYYCYAGFDEEITISLSSAITYRLLKSAVDKSDDTIVIKDYFINLVDSKCYTDVDLNSQVSTCTTYISSNEDLTIDSSFMKSYAAIYEHVFEMDTDGNYHWVSSTKIS